MPRGKIVIPIYRLDMRNGIALRRLNQYLINKGLEKGYDQTLPAGLEEILGPELDLPDDDNMSDEEDEF